MQHHSCSIKLSVLRQLSWPILQVDTIRTNVSWQNYAVRNILQFTFSTKNTQSLQIVDLVYVQGICTGNIVYWGKTKIFGGLGGLCRFSRIDRCFVAGLMTMICTFTLPLFYILLACY